MTVVPAHLTRAQCWANAADARLEDLLKVLQSRTDLAEVPHAGRIEQEVPVYDAGVLRAAAAAADPGDRLDVQAEIIHVLSAGPGIIVVEGAFAPPVLDRVTAAFTGMIEEQRAAGTAAGDHFAKPGANDRVWNALEKLAVADPEAFADYYASDVLAMVCEAWLGPGYQVTSQVNVVNPGGEGQTVHRDYHLGFQSPEVSARYPLHVHALSPALTLQGAVAHCDMPVESGPTLYLPHSQKYALGYLAYWLKEFQDYFADHHVQLPLRKGDAVFFNPALLHAAGSNHSSDIKRMANLLQISSAFGRAMEAVDRERMVNAVYPVLLSRKAAGWDARALASVIAATAEGYSFPTNLDRDQPIGGMAPLTQAALVAEALAADAPPKQLAERLVAHAATKLSH